MDREIAAEIAEIKERLARLEEKVDWLVKMCARRNNSDKLIKYLIVLWLTFLSTLLGIEFGGKP